MNMSKSLAGKKAIVTGGSRGIGAGIALELAKRGADVLITYASSVKKAEDVSAQIKALGVDCIVVKAQGTDKNAPAEVVKAIVTAWGRIDIIINNAAVGPDVFLEDLTYDVWEETLDCNLRFPTFLVKAAMPHFGTAPRIVNISSVAARTGGKMYTPYTASKAALEGVTKVWAIELGQKYGATVNCVNPGPVATDMWNGTDGDLQAAKSIKIQETPAAARVGTIDDIAQIVAFLSEEASRWTTGSTVNANGGWLFV